MIYPHGPKPSRFNSCLKCKGYGTIVVYTYHDDSEFYTCPTCRGSGEYVYKKGKNGMSKFRLLSCLVLLGGAVVTAMTCNYMLGWGMIAATIGLAARD